MSDFFGPARDVTRGDSRVRRFSETFLHSASDAVLTEKREGEFVLAGETWTVIDTEDYDGHVIYVCERPS